MGDRVFVTLGLDAPVEMLDAASGETLRTFSGSEKTEEIIVHQGTLLAAVGDPNILTDAVADVVGFLATRGKRREAGAADGPCLRHRVRC